MSRQLATLVKKCAIESAWLFAACSLALFSYTWIRVWLVSKLEMTAFATIIEQVWDRYEKFSPIPLEQLLTYSGRIAVTFDEPIILFCLTVWAVARGSDAVSGELGRGTLEMMLGHPVTRLQTLIAQSSVNIVGAGLLSLVVWSGIWVGVATTQAKRSVKPTIAVPGTPLAIPKYWADDETVVEPMSDYVDPLEFAPGVLNLFSLTVFFAALTSLISALDRYRWRTVGVACSIYVVQATMMFVAMAAPEWGWLKRLTIFGAYEPQVHVATAMRNPDSLWSIVRIGEDGAWAGCGATGAAILLLVLAGTCWTAAAIVYRRRDLPAP